MATIKLLLRGRVQRFPSLDDSRATEAQATRNEHPGSCQSGTAPGPFAIATPDAMHALIETHRDRLLAPLPSGAA